MGSLSEQQLNQVFQALADPTRRAVVQQLCARDASVSDLAEPFGMALPSFTQHLKVLESCGLITSEKQGRTRICSLNQSTFIATQEWLDQQRTYWSNTLDALAEYVESHPDH